MGRAKELGFCEEIQIPGEQACAKTRNCMKNHEIASKSLCAEQNACGEIAGGEFGNDAGDDPTGHVTVSISPYVCWGAMGGFRQVSNEI